MVPGPDVIDQLRRTLSAIPKVGSSAIRVDQGVYPLCPEALATCAMTMRVSVHG